MVAIVLVSVLANNITSFEKTDGIWGVIFRNSFRGPRTIFNRLTDQKGKIFHTDNKKVIGYGISLPNTLTRIEKSCRVTIYENRHRGGAKTRHNQFDEMGGGGEFKESKSNSNEGPL